MKKAPQKTKTDAPCVEHAIKTLSVRQTAFMLLRVTGLPCAPHDVDDLIRHLAKKNRRRFPEGREPKQNHATFTVAYRQ